jgi:hypothetical protein
MVRMGAALRRHLDDDGAAALEEFVRDTGIEWKRDVTDQLTAQLGLLASTELVTSHVAAIRADVSLLASKEFVTSQVAAVRSDMSLLASKEFVTGQIAAVRADMGLLASKDFVTSQIAAVRADMSLLASKEQIAALRVEMAEGFARIRKEMGDQRVELLRWTFLFWIGQVAAMAGLLSLAMRYAR